MFKAKLCTLIYPIFLLLIFSCSKEKINIQLINTNFKQQKTFILDYANAFKQGFVIPSEQVDGIASLKFSFQVKNFNKDTLYYKLYYQNESYKFGNTDTLNSENFYGCSAATLAGFNKVGVTKNKVFMINDSIIIKGNPRNEKRYFGSNTHRYGIDTNNLALAKHTIQSDTVWYKKIIAKAKKSNITIKKQLKLDALWVINHDEGKNENNKWERNLRVGKYSVLLVITDKQGVAKTPKYISNTTHKSNGGFINPYAYFSKNKNYFSLQINPIITVKAEVPIKNGIYIPHLKYTNTSYFSKNIGDSKTMFDKAAFTIQATAVLSKEIANIPIKAKFLSQNYTKQDYVNNIKKYKGKRVKTRFTNTTAPGKTFGIDSTNNTLWFKNPYYKNKYKKENVGVKTRHGFTYGKYTFKIKMANLLTKDNVWTGLTNALWLIKESGEKWNNRRICNGEGFMPYYGAGKGAKRVPKISYSEIDFEILKTAETWPNTSYPDQLPRKEPSENDDKVMVTCTNWDMACTQPKNFNVGIQKINYHGLEFYPHRWDYYYNALTAKSPQKDSELFNGNYFYFQIEWKPKEIIWRIGANKDNLRVVCYMNDKITTIPNNQMVAVITQEYHFAEWWPKSPYKQQNIPFIGEDLKGRLYSLEIE